MAAEQKYSRETLEAADAIKPSKFMHEHPADVPDEVRAQPVAGEKGEPVENSQVCVNWGCGKDFEADRNDVGACVHHSGRYEFGSEHGLWPEGWTCCRGAWDEMGCSAGKHKGYPKSAQIKFCINHGKPNRKFRYPDSFCGKQFVISDDGKHTSGGEDGCAIHAGQFRCKRSGDKNGTWTCC
jgi:hypothetical protein